MGKTLELKEEDFEKLEYHKLITLFIKNKDISVYVKDKDRLDLVYIKSYYIGDKDTKFSDVIIFSHARRLPKEYIDDDDEERFTIVTKKILSPLKINEAIKILQDYYWNLKEERILKIKSLSKREVKKIGILTRNLFAQT